MTYDIILCYITQHQTFAQTSTTRKRSSQNAVRARNVCHENSLWSHNDDIKLCAIILLRIETINISYSFRNPCPSIFLWFRNEDDTKGTTGSICDEIGEGRRNPGKKKKKKKFFQSNNRSIDHWFGKCIYTFYIAFVWNDESLVRKYRFWASSVRLRILEFHT